MKPAPIKRASTLFLKTVIVVIGLAALALCLFFFPNAWAGIPREWPIPMPILYLGFAGLYLTIIPFLFALYQALTLLRLIDRNDAFSASSVVALRNIAVSAIAMTALYMAAMPLAYAVAELDDAPGLILVSFAFACAPLVIATFAAVLQTLVQSAVDMKAEHDLTV